MAFTTGMTAFRRIAPLALLGSLALALTGCTLGTVQLSGPAPAGSATVANVTGHVIGGEQPVTGATLTIYTVGTSGYGPALGSNTGATAISGATAFTDANGNFQFSAVTCSNANALTYIVATGGDPGLGTPTGFNTINDVNGGVYLLTLNNSGVGAPTYATGSTIVISGLTGSAAFLNGSQTVIAGNVAPNAATVEISGPTDNSGNTGYSTTTGLIDSSANVNPALKLVTASGQCGSLNNLVINIDEVATAANAYALAQYTDPISGQIGAPSTTQAQTAFANALQNLPLLVTAYGQPVPVTYLPSGSTAATAVITATPESAKLSTIANIIAACVNSNGSTSTGANCNTLFSNAGAGTATDTFGAAVEMAQRPYNTTAKVNALYGLQTPQPPFPGGIAAAPTDWTLGINFVDVSSGTPYLLHPQNVAIDGSGNVWVLSNLSATGALAELSPNGSPLLNPQSFNVIATASGATSAALWNWEFSTVGSNPRNLAIDTNNNVWFTQSSSATDTQQIGSPAAGIKANGAVIYYNPTSGASIGYSTAKAAYSLSIDGANDVFVGEESSSATGTVYDFPGGINSFTGAAAGAAAGSAATASPVVFPLAGTTPGTAGTSNGTIQPEYSAIDASGNLWLTGGSSSSSNAYIYELTNIQTASAIATQCAGTYPCTLTTSASTSTSTAKNEYFKVPTAGITEPWGVTATAGYVYVPNALAGNNVSQVSVSATPPATAAEIGSSASFTLPHYAATDGAGNIWVSNTNSTPAGAGATTGGSITELSATGTILSPSSTSITTVNPGYVHTGFTNGAGIAVDPSGNVWAANSGNAVFEIIGSATPVVTPIAAALAAGSPATKP